AALCEHHRPITPVSSFPPPSPTAIYTLSLHDALPISGGVDSRHAHQRRDPLHAERAVELRIARLACVNQDATLSHPCRRVGCLADRKSTRLNSSHVAISYAVFCLKKKKHKKYIIAI